MNMYICKECGRLFEYPHLNFNETVEHFGSPVNEIIYSSPCCDSDYKETLSCAICGEQIERTYIRTSEDAVICSHCYEICDILSD